MTPAYGARESLGIVEAQIREQAEKVKTAKDKLARADRGLSQLIRQYQEQREHIRRGAWRAVGLGWCSRCKKFHPAESIKFLYTEEREWHGSHGYESYGLYRRLRSFCNQCTYYHLSRPRGGESEFQCYSARERERGVGFEIFISGKWVLVADLGRIMVEIEKPYISESEYNSGKPICLEGFPFTTKLTIGDERVI